LCPINAPFQEIHIPARFYDTLPTDKVWSVFNQGHDTLRVTRFHRVDQSYGTFLLLEIFNPVSIVVLISVWNAVSIGVALLVIGTSDFDV
jgi:hypothetical protein